MSEVRWAGGCVEDSFRFQSNFNSPVLPFNEKLGVSVGERVNQTCFDVTESLLMEIPKSGPLFRDNNEFSYFIPHHPLKLVQKCPLNQLKFTNLFKFIEHLENDHFVHVQ